MLNYFTDVIPLRDYYSLWFASNAPPARAWPAPTPRHGKWMSISTPTHDYGIQHRDYPTPSRRPQRRTPSINAANPPRYVAAWHDDMPAMVRILIKVDDPNNKVKDGPWYEYVFQVEMKKFDRPNDNRN